MKYIRTLFYLGAIVGVTIASVLPVAAVTTGGGSVQGYAADAPLDNGTIVQLTGKDSNQVKVSTQDEVQNMFGVVVDKNTLPLTISNSGIQNETFVAVSGTYNVLVSTQAGAIAAGDYVTLSSINGIAMRAGTEETTVFGRANGGFDGKGVNLGAAELKDHNGGPSQKVQLGSVSITIDIRTNPNDESTEANLPEPLRRLGKAIAEKEVSPLRMYLSLGITAVSIIAAIAILYAGVRNGVVAIGRNPMTKKSIFRALLEVILTSLLILIVGLFAVYLLLRL